MALSISVPTSPGSSVSATYHNISAFNASKLPSAVNGAGGATVEFFVSSFGTQADRASGVAPLFTGRKFASGVDWDNAVLPQLYASLVASDPLFAGAVPA